MERKCEYCLKPLPKDVHPSRRFHNTCLEQRKAKKFFQRHGIQHKPSKLPYYGEGGWMVLYLKQSAVDTEGILKEKEAA
jgi:hypothetical protein